MKRGNFSMEQIVVTLAMLLLGILLWFVIRRVMNNAF